MLIQERLREVYERVRRAAQACDRSPAEISVLAVSKTFPPQAVTDAMQCGQRAFGENYAREGIDKMQAVAGLLAIPHASAANRGGVAVSPEDWKRLHGPPEWHFIGPIQSNKTRAIAEHFDWVHSVDRWQIAQRLSEQRPPDLVALQVCIQVNISGEQTKSGVDPPAVGDLARRILELPRVQLRGLMAIPEPSSDPQQQRLRFRALRELKDALAGAGVALDTLSMGMSDDLEAAVAEGATIVRIGRAIFGERPAKQPRS